ncbi:transposase orfB protein [Cupriavidus necator N-1]|uniref:Transposase orfB protein n=1 Tax=Cupriavidus necator (strain ATCC 43291 / DSM 13513 / CCUG 52238 / LMG 8453 / N-1) TaxID=1042878 RepID=F8GPZ6_CUPNN|nr:transposase orfB protein [Cupriavidus necator N-1]
MIADRTCRAVSFLAARVKSRLRFAAHTGHKARQSLAHPAFRPSTVKSGGFCVRSSPRAIASHSAVQDFYFGPDFLLRRHDYELEVSGGLAVAQYVHDFVASGFPASKERVERLMRDNGIRARHKRRYKVTTDSKHKLPVAENLLARSFTPTAPNQVLAEYGMRCSMSRKGNCQDNAPTESFFNSLKNERVHATRYRTHQEAMADLFEYIEVFYSRSRRHSSLGFVSPVQFLQNWLKAQQTEDAAA